MSTQAKLTAPGTASADIDNTPVYTPFTADGFEITRIDKTMLFAAVNTQSPNVIGFFFTKQLAPGEYNVVGEHNVGEDEVSAYYKHTYSDGPRPLYATSGKINIISLNLITQKFEATFHFTTEYKEPGDEGVEVTNGKLNCN